MSTLLLDTHVWIWLINGNEELTKSIRKKINVAAQQSTLYIAAISLWEIGMLVAKNRITLGMPCLEWITKSLALSRIQVVPLSPTIAIESCSLPGEFHEDPADRMITATARVEGLTLVTRDEKILQYSRKKYVNTLQA